MFNKKRFYFKRGPLEAPRHHIYSGEYAHARVHPISCLTTLQVPPFPLPRNNPDVSPVTRTKEHETYHFPTPFVAEIEGGRVLERDGVVITPDNVLLADTAIHFGRPITQHRLFKQRTLSAPQTFSGRLAVLASLDSAVYFHWMCNNLPRFGLLTASGIPYDALYITEPLSAYEMPTLQALGLHEQPLVRGGHIQADTLIVPSLPGRPCDCSPFVCDFLRDTFLPKQLPPQTRRLYLSRAGAKQRRIVNERALIKALAPLGFALIRPEQYTVQQQAALFASATDIIAPHGAALTNLAFCQPGTRVFELFHPSRICDCYWQISHYLGLEHHALMAPKPTFRDVFQRENIQIDPARLLEWINCEKRGSHHHHTQRTPSPQHAPLPPHEQLPSHDDEQTAHKESLQRE